MKKHKRDDCKVCSRSIARQSGVYCPFTSEIVASNVKGDAVDDGNVFLQRGGTRFISDRIVEPGDVASRREESTLLRVPFVQRAPPRIIISLLGRCRPTRVYSASIVPSPSSKKAFWRFERSEIVWLNVMIFPSVYQGWNSFKKRILVLHFHVWIEKSYLGVLFFKRSIYFFFLERLIKDRDRSWKIEDWKLIQKFHLIYLTRCQWWRSKNDRSNSSKNRNKHTLKYLFGTYFNAKYTILQDRWGTDSSKNRKFYLIKSLLIFETIIIIITKTTIFPLVTI